MVKMTIVPQVTKEEALVRAVPQGDESGLSFPYFNVVVVQCPENGSIYDVCWEPLLPEALK